MITEYLFLFFNMNTTGKHSAIQQTTEPTSNHGLQKI